jgi:hypothetical protein
MSFDTGVVMSQVKADRDSDFAADYDFVGDAEVAASQADAILDSLQMPRLSNPVPTAVTVVPSSSSSSDGSADKEDVSIASSSKFHVELESHESEVTLMRIIKG